MVWIAIPLISTAYVLAGVVSAILLKAYDEDEFFAIGFFWPLIVPIALIMRIIKKGIGWVRLISSGLQKIIKKIMMG